jgi:pimeloyl-ACP methyl ester carboxylesterase
VTTIAAKPRVVFVDGVPMSGLIAVAEEPRAVIVAFHGGSSTAAYFDCPGYPNLSLLRTGAERGFTMVALDRPGYGSSAPYPEAMERPEQRVALAYGAIDKILGSKPRGAGLFLMGHSAGCELAVRLAIDESAERANLIGLELAGTGVRYADAMADIMKSVTETGRPAGLRELLWEPAHLYPPDVLSDMTNSSTGAVYEVGMTKSWPRQDFPELAPRVRVPVQFSVAEYERVWRSDAEAVAQIGAMFTASPRFDVNTQPEVGHNLSLSFNAPAYHHSVLSFVEECVLAQQDTTGKLEAR